MKTAVCSRGRRRVSGGSYKVTKDLSKKYGQWRVLDTIAENSFTGAHGRRRPHDRPAAIIFRI